MDEPTGPYLTALPKITYKQPTREPRLVQLHGASGSGKTTLIRHFIRDMEIESHEANRAVGRQDMFHSMQKKPIAEVYLFEHLPRPVVLIGHYQAACGGADTLKSRALPYEIAREALIKGYDVLVEGIFLSVEVWRVKALQEDAYARWNVFLDIPIEDCEESVQQRREAAGKARRPLKQMEAYHPRIMHTFNRLAGEGVDNLVHVKEPTTDTTRAKALSMVKELLR